MKKSNNLWVSFIGALIVGCGSSGGSSTDVPVTPSGVLSATSAKMIANPSQKYFIYLAQLGPYMVDSRGAAMPAQFVAMGVTAFPALTNCKTYSTVSGSSADADNDHIPDQLAFQYNC